MPENTAPTETFKGVGHQPLVRLSDPLPNVPEDDYDPAYTYEPAMPSAEDSMARGFWVWRRRLIGFVGRKTGVMLCPEWVEVLEPNDENSKTP